EHRRYTAMTTTAAATTAAGQLLTYQRRLERLLEQLRAQSLDAFLITNPENRRYMSGFTGHDSGADSAGALLVAEGRVALITDGRYTEQAEQECPGVRIVKRDGDFAPLAAQTLLDLGARRVGFEATHLTVALRDDLEAALGAIGGATDTRPELAPTRRVVEP